MLTATKISGQLEFLYGIMAEFDDPESLLAAARRAYAEGYREMDAYAPMPVEGLADAIGFRSNWVQRVVFAGGLVGRSAGSCCAGGSRSLHIRTTSADGH